MILGADGVLAGAAPGTVLVDMSTSEPALAREIAAAAAARGVASLDAPVSGGDVGAREARLSIMVGGDAATFERVRPLFERMGKTIVHQGPAGSGQHTKMVNQILIATGMIGVCEALLYARRSGLDVATVLASVSGGAAGSWSLTNYVPRIEKGDLAPGFMIEHFVKDMRIALAESKRMGLTLPGLALAERLYASLLDAGPRPERHPGVAARPRPGVTAAATPAAGSVSVWQCSGISVCRERSSFGVAGGWVRERSYGRASNVSMSAERVAVRLGASRECSRSATRTPAATAADCSAARQSAPRHDASRDPA